MAQLQKATANSKEQEFEDVCSLGLPFSLQDLCLLVVVDSLDTNSAHQIELLASLPRWLRQRILSVLPALDLGRLENTPVAAGVNVNLIWESRWKAGDSRSQYIGLVGGHHHIYHSDFSSYVESLNKKSDKPSFHFSINRFGTGCSDAGHGIFSEEMSIATKDVRGVLSHGKLYLLSLLSKILTGSSTDIDLRNVIHKLVSIDGDLVFSNMLVGSMHDSDSCKTSSLCAHRVWKKQATALAVNLQFEKDKQRPLLMLRNNTFQVVNDSDYSQLTPHCLLPLLQKVNPLEILSLLTRNCDLNLSSAFIDINTISPSILLEMCRERLTSNDASNLPCNSYTSLLNHLIRKVSVLGVCCYSYNHVGAMINIIDAVISSKENCRLKYLFCTTSNLYMELLQSFSSLYTLPSFYALALEASELCPFTFCKLLQEFMTVSSSREHKLMIQTSKMDYSEPLKVDQVASLKFGASDPLPASYAKYKVLKFSPHFRTTYGLYFLLQLPSIRVKEIALNGAVMYGTEKDLEYIHLCAVHPDLLTTKLVINLDETAGKSTSLQADLASLLQMPSLRKLIVTGNWNRSSIIKSGLVQALNRRSRSLPFTKLIFLLTNKDCYKIAEFRALCDAIFSLPELESLKLVLGKGFGDMLRQSGFEQTLFRSWNRNAAKVQLKSLCIDGYNSKSLTPITQEYSTSTNLYSKYPSYQTHYSSEFDLLDALYDHHYGYYDYDDDDDDLYDPWDHDYYDDYF